MPPAIQWRCPQDTVVDVLAAQRDDVAEIDRTLNGGVASGGGDAHPEGYYRALWKRICDPLLGWFQLASYLVIVCQVILLACETPNMAPWRRGLLDGFTIFFQILWAMSADEDSNFGSDDIPASAYAGAAGAVTAGSAVANPVGHSAELDYTGPELAHSAELDYQGADDLPELLPREAAQAPAPRGFARPGDLSAGGGVV